jgi:hypothetical protein
MHDDPAAVESRLRATRTTIGELNPPSTAGVYAIFLLEPSALKPFAPGRDGLIYVGTSSNLAQREFENHLDSSSTGFSTLRRSLGAILRQQLSLEAIPRSPGRSESNVRCYRFTPDGDVRLTEWMRSNLHVGAAAAPDSDGLEAELIARMQPLLNLTGWSNPDRPVIKALRKSCADEARACR